MANIRYNGMQPINRYSLNQRVLPGQYKRLGGTNLFTNKTFIQNNFYGGGFGHYDYGSYGCDGQCNGGGNNKFMNWMMGLGMLSTVLGGIFKMFSSGDEDVEGKGGDNPKKAADPNEALKKENDALKKKIEQLEQKTVEPKDTKEEVVPPKVTVEPKVTKKKVEQPKVETSPFDMFKDGLEMVCHDNSGNTKDISGKLSNVTGEAGKAPTSFVITDTSSGTSNAYKYEATGDADKNGNPIYKCVSKNGVAISGSSEYTFVNGKLVQYDNQPNYGRGMKFGTIKNPPTKEITPTPDGWATHYTDNKAKGTLKRPEAIVQDYLSELKISTKDRNISNKLIQSVIDNNPKCFDKSGNPLKDAKWTDVVLPTKEQLIKLGFEEDKPFGSL